MKNNKQRILEISKDLGTAHIGSCLSTLPVLEEIYSKKRSSDIVILDNAHAHIAHMIVKSNLPEYFLPNIRIKQSIKEHGIHCDRKAGCDASGGSLGHALGIAIGYALSDRKRDVYVIVSDGSIMEGSCWEALRLIDAYKLRNIKIYTNFNSYTAVAKIDRDLLVKRMKAFVKNINVRYTDNGEGFEGLAGHYKTI